MIVVIDTSSLLALVRYYGRFDTNSKMFDFIKSNIESGELIIIDEVLNECRGTSKGLVVKTMDYLVDKTFQKQYKVPTKTRDMLAPAPAKFINQVDNNFKAPGAKKLNDAEYEIRKSEFLKSADARMIIYVLNVRHQNAEQDIRIVTEETEGSNDNKAFKKIPAICKFLNIKVQTLPDLLEEYRGINLEIK